MESIRPASHWRPAAVILAIPQLTLALALLLQSLGAFQPAELWLHDLWLRLLADNHPAPVVFVGANEEDLNRFGWPLSDERLADALEIVGSAKPRAIGIDLYRDQPRPPGQARLDAALQGDPRVIAAFRAGEGGNAGIAPPAALLGTDRVGFSDLPIDADGLIRRTALFMDDGKTAYTSLAARLAFLYLAAQGIAPRGEADGTMVLGPTRIPPFGADDGAYAGADDAGYQIILDFRAGLGGINQVRLGDVLDGKLDPERLRDKVVLIGIASESVKDLLPTPLNRGANAPLFMPGPMVHGHVVDQLIRHGLGGNPPTGSLSPLAKIAWVWAWCMVATALAWALRGSPVLVLASTACVACIALLGWAAAALHWWIPVALPAAGCLASAVLASAWLGKMDKEQRELLMRMFAANVSPALAAEMWRQRDFLLHDGRPLPQELTATVLFTDLRDFTTVSEGLDAPRLFEWLNIYMAAMSAVVVRHGGVIDKYVGDAIMAVFGVPIARRNREEMAADARSAVDCALAMADELEALNLTLASHGLPQAQMRVGIFSGPVAAGTLGGRERLNYTVIGDTVNIASRLESFDKSVGADRQCRIIAGGTTVAMLGGDYRVTPVGTVVLKGKSQPVEALLVDGRTSSARPEE